MKIPIPALVVPVVCLLLYLFVPGLRQRPWTTLRIAGVIVAIAGSFSAHYRSSSVGEIVFCLAAGKATRYARSLCADSESHLCLRWRYVVRLDRGAAAELVVRAFGGVARHAIDSSGSGGKGPAREVRTGLSQLPEANLVLTRNVWLRPYTAQPYFTCR